MTYATPHRGLRVVVAEHAGEGQDGCAARIARALRDAGHEVVHTGLHPTPEQLVETAIQEDADVIGLWVPSGDQAPLLTALVGLLRAREVEDVVVFAGGVGEEDSPRMLETGVAQVFGPAAPGAEIARWLAEHVRAEPAPG